VKRCKKNLKEVDTSNCFLSIILVSHVETGDLSYVYDRRQILAQEHTQSFCTELNIKLAHVPSLKPWQVSWGLSSRQFSNQNQNVKSLEASIHE